MLLKVKRLPVLDRLLIVLVMCEMVVCLLSINRYLNLRSNIEQNISSYNFVGEGTISNPFLISDGDDLRYLSILVNGGNTFDNTYFQLTDDIDMDHISMEPIGIYESGYYFFGTLDGNGHTLSNLVISTGGNDGLFGMLGGTIMNLGIESGFIGNANYEGCCGAFSSHAATGTARIINCYNKATVGGYRAGGIADNFAGIIINSWSDCELMGVEKGGTTSYIGSAGSQTFCYSTSAIGNDGTGTWFEVRQITEDELYSKSMANRLSANALVWFETLTPVKWMNKWEFEDGCLKQNNKMSIFDLCSVFWLFVYATDYYTWILTTTYLLIAFMILMVYRYIKTRYINQAESQI